MAIQIKQRLTDKILFSSETATSINKAVIEAVQASTNLSRANLSGADLSGADLSGADLSGANLSGADLSGADLLGANLWRANLSGADLSGADLSGADLSGADLSGADLSGADLSGADLSDAINLPALDTPLKTSALDVPVITNIHQTLLAAVTSSSCSLNMTSWHTCDTTHCRAGWVVHLAGEKGAKLEEKVGTQKAASMIYRASDPAFLTPWFYAPTDVAMSDIKRCAALEKEFGTAARR